METIGRRLQILRGATSRRAFAETLGLTESTLRNYENDLSLPQSDLLAKICAKIGIEPRWLLTGAGAMCAGEDGRAPQTPQEETPSAGYRNIPVMGLASCGMKGWFNTGPVALSFPLAAEHSGPAMFAVIAVGTSMQPEGIREGYVVLCDPNAEPLTGEPVYVEKKDGTASIKIYRGRNDKWLTLQGWLEPAEDGTQKPYTEQLAVEIIDRMAGVVLIKRR